ncbi:MAG TPA: hypothetical protein VKE42_07330 [Candidatus Cybelea sp.]|nr:hypothetical protein [Candidatus Cybelea sp.]
MPPLGFSDEEMNAIAALASALPRHARSEFFERIASRLAKHSERGAGLVYRVAIEVQRPLLHERFVAVGVERKRSGKYGRSPRDRRR